MSKKKRKQASRPRLKNAIDKTIFGMLEGGSTYEEIEKSLHVSLENIIAVEKSRTKIIHKPRKKIEPVMDILYMPLNVVGTEIMDVVIKERAREIREDGYWCVGLDSGGSVEEPVWIPAWDDKFY